MTVGLSFAGDSNFDAGFNEGLKTSVSSSDHAIQAMENFHPEKIIKNYTDRPKESHYKNNPAAIKEDAVSFRNEDPVAKSISKSFSNPHQFNIQSASPSIQEITNRSHSIYANLSNQYSDCTKKTSCNVTYKTETCEEAPKSTYQYCKKTLNIKLVPHQVDTHYSLTGFLYVSDHHYAGISVNAVSGRVNFLGPHDASFRLEGRLPEEIDCHTLQGKVISNVGDGYLDSTHLPSCDNGLTFDFHISSGHSRVIKIDMVSSTQSLEVQDDWNDDCTGFANAPSCVLKEERCVAPQSTHDIQGISVARDCWEKEVLYQCGGGSAVAACEPLRSQGCEQIGSYCQKQNDGGCELYQQTFRCPVKQCTDIGMICNGKTYCLEGDCIKQKAHADPDFQKAVSALSTVNAAAKSFTDFDSIFAGVKKTCDRVATGFVDCCANEGWGKDSHLAECTQEEKDLGTARENLQTVYVGEYCKRDPLGICIEHRKAYCVFPSKLARIIQTQGRRDQLGISFGDPDNVNCRGLLREEFAKLDFSKMDFSDFYADITKKERIEEPAKLNQRVSGKVAVLAKEEKPYD